MDTGKVMFEEAKTKAEAVALEKQYPNHGGWFTVGEHITIRGSKFRVKSVKPTELRLKLLPRAK